MNTARPAALTMVAILMIVCGAAATAQSKPQSKIDISGSWVFTMQNAAGSVPAQVTLTVDGARLTGHINSTISGEQSFVGVVYNVGSGGFQFAFDGDACSVNVVGNAENRTTLKGTFDNPGNGGAGTFTATRKSN